MITALAIWLLCGLVTAAYVAWKVRGHPPLRRSEIAAFIGLGPLTFIAVLFTRKEQTHG